MNDKLEQQRVQVSLYDTSLKHVAQRMEERKHMDVPNMPVMSTKPQKPTPAGQDKVQKKVCKKGKPTPSKPKASEVI